VPERVDDDGRVVTSEDDLLDAASDSLTKVLAVSHVQWGTGQRMELGRLGAFCRERGIFFSVDAIQSVGVVPIDVRRDRIDALQAGGHKWMMGTMGAGIFHVRREMIDRVRPSIWGSQNVINPMQWDDIAFVPNEGALRYEYGAPAMLNITATGIGLAMLHDLGIDAVFERVKRLCDRFAGGVEELGMRVVTPRDADRAETCSGSVCFVAKDGTAESSKAIFRRLAKEHDTELAFRCGRVRFSPHFYNTEAQIDRLLNRL
jgi:selenocysteine lyase/cysteine desulfurase